MDNNERLFLNSGISDNSNSGICGQSLTEFALCLVVITTAFIAMQMYVQRNLQVKQKDAIEYLHSKIEEAALVNLVNAESNLVNAESSNNLVNNLKDRQYEVFYKESKMTENTESEITIGLPDSTVYQQTKRFGEEKTGF